MTVKTWWSGINGVKPLTLAEARQLQLKDAQRPDEKGNLWMRSERYERWAQASRMVMALESESKQRM